MRKVTVGFALFVIVAVAAYLRFHHKGPIDVAYAGNRQVTLWSTTAQVREPVAIVNFGERLDVLDSFEEEVNVRAPNGATGWVSEHDLLSAELWEQARALEAKAAAMPSKHRGHTKVLSNLHLDAGRDAARIRQLSRDVFHSISSLVNRSTSLRPIARTPIARIRSEDNSPSEPAQAKKEDWWLVRAHPSAEAPFSGWILGRFIELDVPAPLPDYASSAGTRIVAWFDLNHAKDSSGNSKTQYLLLGAKGPEGQA